MPQHQDVTISRDYFSHWASYKSAVDADYIHHVEMIAAVHAVLVARGFVGDLLDLGCGDAAPIPSLVADLPLASYTGMDVTPEALDLARSTVAVLGVPVTLLQADFAGALTRMDRHFDTVFVSLAMHHLTHDDKPAFFSAARERLRPNGLLVIYEPSSRPGESRADYIARQAPWFSSHFTRMEPVAVDELNDHVRQADFPESPGTYAGMAIDAGFTGARVVYLDPQHFWAALAFTA